MRPKPFAVLQYLAEHRGRLVTKDELLSAVWPKVYVTDAVLKVCIQEIRRVLEDSARAPRCIETLHRRGYRFLPQAQEVASPSPGEPVRLPASGPPAPHPRLIGRGPALEQLERLLEKGLDGERQVAFVTGEPGIGKTSLVQAFIARVSARRPDVRIASGQCVDQYGGHEAYLPVLGALAPLCRAYGAEGVVTVLGRYAPTWLAQMPWLLGPSERSDLERAILGATRERMLRELAEALAELTTQQPLLLVLEDLQWSDTATVDLISYLARRPESARLLLLGTYRPVDVILKEHPLKGVTQALRMQGACAELPLPFLSAADVAEYLDSRFLGHRFPPALVQAIHRQTDGNPLFVANVLDLLRFQDRIRETPTGWVYAGEIRDIASSVPEGLRQMIEERLEQLTVEQRGVLEAASVVGREFSAAAVAAGLELDVVGVEDFCQGLVRQAQFLQADGVAEGPDGTVSEGYRFVHDLYPQVLYQRLPAARRARLHQRIGEQAEERYGAQAPQRAAELARHFEGARDARRAIQYLRMAAETAAHRYANREGAEYLTRALHWVERLPAGEQLGQITACLMRRGALRRAMADLQGAVEDFGLAAHKMREIGDQVGQVRALIEQGITVSWSDRERCYAVGVELDGLSQNLCDPSLRAYIKGWLAYGRLNMEGWRDEDFSACRLAVDGAREAGDGEGLTRLLGRSSFFQALRSDYAGAAHTAQEGAERALAAGAAADYMSALYLWAWADLHGGEWGRMHAVLTRGLNMAERNAQHHWVFLFQHLLAWLYLQVQRFEEAREICARGVQEARTWRYPFGELLSPILLGTAHLGLEQYGETWTCLDGVLADLQRRRVFQDWILGMPLHHALGRYWLARGKPVEAARAAKRLHALASAPGEHTYLAFACEIEARAALLEGDGLKAEARIGPALKAVGQGPAPLAAWRVYATAGELCEAQGDPARSKQYFAQSAAELTRLAASLGDLERLRRSLLGSPHVLSIRARVG